MTDVTPALTEKLNDLSHRTTKAQHEGLDDLLGRITSYRASLRTQPDFGLARVNFLKDMQSIIGMLTCADGRQSVIRDLRQAIDVEGLLTPSLAELLEQEAEVAREELVNEVLDAADELIDSGLQPHNMEARILVNTFEAAVKAVADFDEESDDDDESDDDTDPAIILPPAMSVYERKTLPELLRMLGLTY